MAATVPAKQPDALVRAFEEWMLDNHPTIELHRYACGAYVHREARLAYSVWQHLFPLPKK